MEPKKTIPVIISSDLARKRHAQNLLKLQALEQRFMPTQTFSGKSPAEFSRSAQAAGFRVNSMGEVINPTPGLVNEFNRGFTTTRLPR